MIDQQVPTSWQNTPTTSGMLKVSRTHAIYWRSFGDIGAMPVVALHGGPGSGSNPQHLTFFDPRLHRVVMFDQRGSGKSTASVVTDGNTTQDLIKDIEAVRRHLRIDRWLVFGMSWGAFLAMLYCQKHPQASSSLLIVGLSNRHAHQTAWILEKRARLLPERHEAFLMTLQACDRSDPIAALYRKSLSTNRRNQLEATYAVWILETGLEGPEPESLPAMALNEIDASMISRAKIYLHYWANRSFLGQCQLLFNPAALKSLPVTLLHGESDWICPLSGAEQVAGLIEHAQLIVVSATGHYPYGAEMTQAMTEFIPTKSSDL